MLSVREGNWLRGSYCFERSSVREGNWLFVDFIVSRGRLIVKESDFEVSRGRLIVNEFDFVDLYLFLAMP